MQNQKIPSEGKLKSKLVQMCESRRLEHWNGWFIKRCRVGDSDSKTFVVGGVKYKLEIEAESKCDNTTNFIPEGPKPVLHDWRAGRFHEGYESISEALGLPVEDLVEIWKPLMEDAKFTEDEVRKAISQYEDAVISFRQNFCLN